MTDAERLLLTLFRFPFGAVVYDHTPGIVRVWYHELERRGMIEEIHHHTGDKGYTIHTVYWLTRVGLSYGSILDVRDRYP